MTTIPALLMGQFYHCTTLKNKEKLIQCKQCHLLTSSLKLKKGPLSKFGFLSDWPKSSRHNTCHSFLKQQIARTFNCTVRGRFISKGKEILTRHFLLCIVQTAKLHMLSTSLAADPDCKGNSERMPSEVLGFKRNLFLLNTTQ